MLKIRKLGQCLTQQSEKKLQRYLQEEADLLCRKFAIAKVTVKVYSGGERQVQTSLPHEYNASSTAFPYFTNIPLEKCGGCCFYYEKELFVNDRFLWDPQYTNILLSLSYRVKTVIYVFLHEFTHFLDITNRGDSMHNAQFRRLCNRLLKPYKIKDQKGIVSYKKVCLYSYT